MTPDKKIVWQYTSRPKADVKGPVEVHAFQRLKNGLTMIAETGNRRIIEVDRRGRSCVRCRLTIDKPNAHRDTRMARKLANGHYLVCHEGDGMVREYDPAGKVVWSYALGLDGRPRTPGHEGHGTDVFGAIRLPSGNTLIAAGSGNRVIEVAPDGEVVWNIGHDELPGIRLFWVTTLQLLPNGNLVVGNCHAGPDNPQLFEVTRDKQVVWTFKDFKTFGNSLAAAQVLDIKRPSGSLTIARGEPGASPTWSKALNKKPEGAVGLAAVLGAKTEKKTWPPSASTATSAAFPSIFSGPSSHPLSSGFPFA